MLHIVNLALEPPWRAFTALSLAQLMAMAENRCALEGRQVNFWGWDNTIVMLLVNNFSLTSANVTTLICKVRLDIVPGSHI